MSSIQRPLSGDVLLFDLSEEGARAADPSLLERSGRNARTLLKSGDLRVTLVVVGPGGEIPEHHAAGPITVQVLQGAVRFSAGGEHHDLAPGQLLSAGPGIAHGVSSTEGGTFLLTLAQPRGE